MRCLQLIAAIGFVVVPVAWAGGRSAPQHAAKAVAAPPPVRQRVSQSRAEVQRLTRDLARQEADSERARERLQQQDQAIAELHRQLQQLRSRPADGRH